MSVLAQLVKILALVLSVIVVATVVVPAGLLGAWELAFGLPDDPFDLAVYSQVAGVFLTALTVIVVRRRVAAKRHERDDEA